MRDVLELAGLLIIPAATAVAVGLAGRMCCPSATSRYVWGAATAFGFLAGCLIFPDRLPLMPERHWHWLPWLGVIAAIIGGASAAGGLQAWERLIMYGVLGCVAAWQLVPNYADLKPARLVLVPLLASYFAALAWLLSLLPARLRGRLFVILLNVVGVAAAVLIAGEVSLRIGFFALRIPAALTGVLLLLSLLKPRSLADLESGILGLIPVFAVLVGGGAFVGGIELSEPLYVLLLIPAAPLMLWLFAFGPLARLSGWRAIAAQTAAVVIVPVAVFLWIFLQAEPDEWGLRDAPPPRSLTGCL